MKYEIGGTAYIVENNQAVSEVTIISIKSGFYTIKCGNSVFNLKEHRLFPTSEEAKQSKYQKKKSGNRSPYNYE